MIDSVPILSPTIYSYLWTRAYQQWTSPRGECSSHLRTAWAIAWKERLRELLVPRPWSACWAPFPGITSKTRFYKLPAARFSLKNLAPLTKNRWCPLTMVELMAEVMVISLSSDCKMLFIKTLMYSISLGLKSCMALLVNSGYSLVDRSVVHVST